MSINRLGELIKSIESDLKEVKKEIKKINKKEKKEKKEIKNSGLNKKYKLSHELSLFLGVDKNKEMTRIEVNREILNYIKEKKLGNKREIIIDDKLKNLIDAEKITYFTLQKYMNKHYLYD